jgi:hypothetical protein
MLKLDELTFTPAGLARISLLLLSSLKRGERSEEKKEGNVTCS